MTHEKIEAAGPVEPETAEVLYECHRLTLPADNGALPWRDAGWGLRAWWEHYARERALAG